MEGAWFACLVCVVAGLVSLTHATPTTEAPTAMPTTPTPSVAPSAQPSSAPTRAPTRSAGEWFANYLTFNIDGNPLDGLDPVIGSAYGFDDPSDPLHDDSGNGVPLVINGSYTWTSHPTYGGYLVLNESARIALQCHANGTGTCGFSALLRFPRSSVPRVSELSNGSGVDILTYANATSAGRARIIGVSRSGFFVGGVSAPLDYPTYPWSDDVEGAFTPFSVSWETGSVFFNQVSFGLFGYGSADLGDVETLVQNGVWLGGVPVHVASLVFSSASLAGFYQAAAEPYNFPAPNGAFYPPVPVAFNPGRLSPIAYFGFDGGTLSNAVAGSFVGAFEPWNGTEDAFAGWTSASYNASVTSVSDFCPDNPDRWCHVGNPAVLLTTTGGVRYRSSTLCYRFYLLNQSTCVAHTASYTTWRPYPNATNAQYKSPFLQAVAPGSNVLRVANANVSVAFYTWTHVCASARFQTSSTVSSVYVNGTLVTSWTTSASSALVQGEDGIRYAAQAIFQASDIFLPTAPCVMTDSVYLYGAALNATEIAALAAVQSAITGAPTDAPTAIPSAAPSAAPSSVPSAAPTPAPSAAPTAAPSSTPSASPTSAPSAVPTAAPSAAPSAAPVPAPTAPPSVAPSPVPTTPEPTYAPTARPTFSPTASVGVVALGATYRFSVQDSPARVEVRTQGVANRRSMFFAFDASGAGGELSLVLTPRSVLAFNGSNSSSSSCTGLPPDVSPIVLLALTCTLASTGAPATVRVTPNVSALFIERADRPARLFACTGGGSWGAVALASATSVTGSSSLLLLGVPGLDAVAGTCPAGLYGCQCTRTSEQASETHVPLLILGAVLVLAASALDFAHLITPVQLGPLFVCSVYALGHIALAASIALLLPPDEYSLDTYLVSRTRHADGTVSLAGATLFRAVSAATLLALPAVAVALSAWGGLEVPGKPKWVPVIATALALVFPLSALARASAPLYAQYIVPGLVLLGAAPIGVLHLVPGKAARRVVYACAAATLVLHAAAVALLLADGLKWACADSFAGDTRLY